MKTFSFNISWVVLLLWGLFVQISLAGEEKAEAKKEEEKPAAKLSVTKADQEAQTAYLKGRQYMLSGEYSKAVPLMEKALKADPDNAYLSHQLSEMQLRMANFERAEELAKKAVQGDPTNVDYLANLAGIYTSLKDYDAAKEQYRKIKELEPNNSRAPLFLGILEAESGDLDKGIDVISEVISEDKENYMAYFWRAKIQLEKQNYPKAKEDLSKCLDIRPSFVEAGSALGLLHEKLGEVDQAIEAYGRIQGEGRFKKRLAQLYLQKNEFEKALRELLEYEKVEVDDYAARLKIALIFFELKRYEEAKDRFSKILEEQPGADVRFYLGAVYEEQKQLDKALKEFRKVEVSSSFHKESMLHIGFILREKGELKEGLAFTKELLSKHPDEPEYYDMRASFFEQKKEFKSALKVIQTGLEKFSKDEKLMYFAGALHDKLGDRTKGIAIMKEILEINDKNAHALNFLGYTYAEMGENLDEAEKYVLKALELRPNDGYIEDSLGWVYFKQGKIEKAIEKLEHALTLQPKEPVILEHLGDIYLQKKDFAKAVEHYELALKISKEKDDSEMAKKIQVKMASLEKEDRVPSTDTKAPTKKN